MAVISERQSPAASSAACPTLPGTALLPPPHPPCPSLAVPWTQRNLFFSSSSPFFPLRPADEPSRELNPSVELTCTSLASKGGRDSGANGPMAKPAGQDAPSTVAVTNFLYGVSLPTQMAVDLKQEVSSGLPGPNAASEALLPRPAGELKVPSSQEYSDCCGNSLEFAKPILPGADRGQARVFWRSSDESQCKAWPVQR